MLCYITNSKYHDHTFGIEKKNKVKLNKFGGLTVPTITFPASIGKAEKSEWSDYVPAEATSLTNRKKPNQ